jgi:ribonuclease HII
MEINGYMNGYQPETDNKFLSESLEAHKTALADSKLKTETAKEFLYQHIQTNKELELKAGIYEHAMVLISEDPNLTIEKAKFMAKKALSEAENEDPSETHTAAHPELYFEK